MRSKPKSLSPLLAELDAVITAATTTGLRETAELLRLARLDLVLRANGLTAQSFDLLSYAQGRAAANSQKREKPPAKAGKPKAVKRPRAKVEKR